jgi:two-component system response regulator DesR
MEKITRILIVDDNPQVRQDLHLLLELSDDLKVVGEAASGEEAIAQVDALGPDMVLMDLALPGMNGFEAAAQIKSRQPDCRVVALSLYGSPQMREKAAEAGMDAFIEKGTPLPEILRMIQQVWNIGPDHS